MSFPGSLLGGGDDAAPSERPAPARKSKKAAAAAPPPTPPSPLRTPLWLLLGALAWCLVLLAMVSHDRADAAFSTAGNGLPTHNRVGALGAWISDLMLFGFGYSCWWLMLVSLRTWLSGLARMLRADPGAAPTIKDRLPAIGGVLLLMAASCALEWTRLYGWESHLPGHAGGVFGYLLGPASMKLLGFAGSGVVWIAALVAGVSLALKFSWLRLSEQIGTAIERLIEKREVRREIAEDKRVGKEAKREREAVVEVERHIEEEHHIPIVIEPPVVEVPKSTRVIKERQQTLFTDPTDAKLP